MTGTVCLACWVAWNPKVDGVLRNHAPRKCQVRWVGDNGEVFVCMCSCARASAEAE